MPTTTDLVPINRMGWTAYATDFFNSSFLPVNMIDGNKHTSWVTPTSFSFPQEIWFDMGSPQTFSGITFQRRQDGPEDSPGPIEIFTSTDGVFWAGPIVSTTWANTGNVIVQPTPTVTAQWIKLSMLGIAAGSRGALSCAEFNVGASVDTNDLGAGGGLTLTCACTRVCSLQKLTLHVDSHVDHLPYGVAGFALLVGGPFTHGATLCDCDFVADFDLSPVADWVDDWSNLEVWFGGAATLLQPPVDGFVGLYGASWYILQEWACVDSVGNITNHRIFSVNTGQAKDYCISSPDSGRIIKQIVAAGPGGGSISTYTSSPFGSCFSGNGWVYVGDFEPAPDVNDLIDPSNTVCLCASGGSPPYKYSVLSGQLPCGQALDPDTGCIVGDAVGICPGSDEITFQAMDSLGRIGRVKCGVIKDCSTDGTGDTTEFGNAFY